MNVISDIKNAIKERLPLEVMTHFCVYAGGKVLISGFSFLAAPIMMILLSPADYGLLSLIHCFNNIAIALLSFGLPQVFMVEYFRQSECERERSFNDILGAYSLCSIPIIIIAMIFPQFIQTYLFMPKELPFVVYAVIGICFISFFNDIFYNILQFQKRAMAVAGVQVLVSALTVCFNIVLIGFFHLTVASAVWVQCALVVGVFIIGVVFYVRNKYYHAFSARRAVSGSVGYLKMGLLFLPSTIVAWIFALLNRWMLAHYAGLELAGIFSLADAGGLLFYRLILHPLQGAYGPALMNSYRQQQDHIHEVERSNHRVMGVVLVGLIVCLNVGYMLVSKFLYSIVPSGYARAIDYVLLVAIGYVWLLGAYFVSNFIQFQKKQLIFIIALAASVACNIILNICMIPSLGLKGCVWSMMLSYGLYFMILLSYNRYMLSCI
jgi:O-antigen/teichoic acid export membrane protein